MITFPFGLSFADIPAACPGLRPPRGEVCTALPRRAASSSRKRPAPLMSHSPRAPLEPARCMQRPRLSPPLCSNPEAAREGRSSSSLFWLPLPVFLQGEASSNLLQAVAAMASPPAALPRLSTALARLGGYRSLTSRIGKEEAFPVFCSRQSGEQHRPPRPHWAASWVSLGMLASGLLDSRSPALEL